MTRQEALNKFRNDVAAAISSATQAGVASRQIADILERQIDLSRLHAALMTPSSFVV
jgi:hypothetical protein